MTYSAHVRHSTASWQLEGAARLAFGRGRECEVRFAHDPEDDYVSRVAGRLELLDDAVLVRNTSTSKVLHLQPHARAEITVAPLTAVAVLECRFVRVVVPGSYGTRHVLSVSGSTTATDPGGGRTPAVVDLVGMTREPLLTVRERLVLTALCEPLLAGGADRRPADYRAVAARTGLTQPVVRKVLDGVRERLSNEFGAPGLQSEGSDVRRGAVNYGSALAVWATSTGLVSLRDLERLDDVDLDDGVAPGPRASPAGRVGG